MFGQILKFGQILRFELRYQLRQPAFYAYLAVFALAGFLDFCNDAAKAGAQVKVNAPLFIAKGILAVGFFGLFAPLAVAANSALRDVQTKMDALIHATPVSAATYVLARFSGAFLLVSLAFCGVVAGMMIGTRMWWVDGAVIGAFRFDAYLWPLMILALPNLFFAGALFFAAASLTQSRLASYIALAAVVVAHFATRFALTEPAQRPIAGLIDPIGQFAFNDITRYWTMVERGTQMIPLEGILLWNRALWIAAGIALLGLAIVFNRPREPASRLAHASQAPAKAPAVEVARRVLVATAGGAGVWSQLLVRTRYETRTMLRSWSFLALVLLGALCSFGGLMNLGNMYGTPLLPMTHIVVDSLASSCFLVALILIVLFSSELVWRERQAKIAELIDAMPVPSFVFLVSKLTAVALLLVALLGSAAAVGVAFQLAKGITGIDPHFYFVSLLVLTGLPALMIGVLSIFIQTAVNQRSLGIVLMLAVVAGLPSLAGWFGVKERLLLFTGRPPVPLSDMNQFGHYLPPALWFLIYWGCGTLLIGLATHALWVRGIPASLPARLRGARHALTPALAVVGVCALLGTVTAGGTIFWNTHVRNAYVSMSDVVQRSLDYERTYRKFETLPQPRIAEVEMAVDLFPESRGFASRGRYILVNRTKIPIDQVHVQFDADVVVSDVALSDAELTDAQTRFNHFVFRPSAPLAPGETRTLTFATSQQHEGFTNDPGHSAVAFNGTFVRNNELAPSIGVSRANYLQGAKERKKHGLAPLESMPKLEDKAHRDRSIFAADADFIRFAITLSTRADQTALAPGYVQREWTADGRRYFRYEMDKPILNFWSVQSARYAVARDQWNGVEIAVYHHPKHDSNVPRMIEAVKQSLAYYSENFGPYQHRQLRIVEFPGYGDFAQSFPNTVPYSESIGFIADNRDPEKIDYVWYVTAHEVAHQWWGHQVTGAAVQGAQFLSETLSQYSALMVMERRYGSDKMRQFLKYEADKYLSARGGHGNEPSLKRVGLEAYVYYHKGAVAMYALKDAVGEAVVNRALAKLVRGHAFKANPYPTSLDFIRLLRKEAGPAHQQLITDLFEKVVLWDLRVLAAEASPTDDGRWRVRLDVHARKLEASADGSEKAVPLDQAIDVGLFTAEPGQADFTAKDVITLEKRRIVGGRQTIELIVDRKPLFAGIDPYIKLIQRNTTNNVSPLGSMKTAAAKTPAP